MWLCALSRCCPSGRSTLLLDLTGWPRAHRRGLVILMEAHVTGVAGPTQPPTFRLQPRLVLRCLVRPLALFAFFSLFSLA
jgi:hypothetical protein